MSMDFYEEMELLLAEMDACTHENIYYRFEGSPMGRHFAEIKLCEDCGAELEEEGPSDDTWIQGALERAAGVGEPNRDYYDGGRLIRA